MPADRIRKSTKVNVRLYQIAATGSAIIDIPELTALYGGRIEAHADEHQRVIPATAQYQVTLTTETNGPPASSTLRGTIQLTAHAESLIAGMWRRALKVFVRESGA